MIRIHTEPKSEQLAQNVAVDSSGSSYVQQAAAAACQLTLTPSEWRRDFKIRPKIFNFFGPRSSDTTPRGYVFTISTWPKLSPRSLKSPVFPPRHEYSYMYSTAISHYFSSVAIKNVFSLHFFAINHVCQRYRLFLFWGAYFHCFSKDNKLKGDVAPVCGGLKVIWLDRPDFGKENPSRVQLPSLRYYSVCRFFSWIKVFAVALKT